MNLCALQDLIGYRFKDESLLETALTHPSYGRDHHKQHYQRLEFLGDAVLELNVSRYLYDHLPDVSEGTLTRIRAALVCEQSLCASARAFRLGESMLMAPGEEKTGGRDKPSILADVLESLIAAIYLDGGMDAAHSFIVLALGDRLDPERLVEDEEAGRTDAKTHLQERVQRDGLSTPIYEMVSVDGPTHEPIYTMQVRISGEVMGKGTGRSKRAAQQAAAQAALSILDLTPE